MKKTFLLLLVCTLLLSGCAAFHQEEVRGNPVKAMGIIKKRDIPKDFISRDIKVVMVGDSLTEGVGDRSKNGGYLPYLKKLLEKEKGINQAELLNFGVSGHRTTQLLDRLEKPKVNKAIKEADIVIITIGGNDMMKVVSENISNLKIKAFEEEKDLYNNRLKQILTTIRSENQAGSIVLVGLYNPFASFLSEIDEIDQVINDWNTSSQNIISKYDHAYYVEISDLFAENIEDLLHSDSFHPNNKGYRLIAKRVYSKLDEEVLKEMPDQLFTATKEEFQH